METSHLDDTMHETLPAAAPDPMRPMMCFVKNAAGRDVSVADTLAVADARILDKALRDTLSRAHRQNLFSQYESLVYASGRREEFKKRRDDAQKARKAAESRQILKEKRLREEKERSEICSFFVDTPHGTLGPFSKQSAHSIQDTLLENSLLGKTAVSVERRL